VSGIRGIRIMALFADLKRRKVFRVAADDGAGARTRGARRNTTGSMTQRIAVIGSGMAGLAAAHGCRQLGHEVCLFESHDGHGMAAHTMALDGGRVDVPLRVMGEGRWDQTLELARSLGIETFAAKVDVSCSWLDGQSWFRSRHMPVTGWPMVGAWRHLGLRSLKSGAGMIRLIRATRRLESPERDLPLGEFVARHDPDRLFWRGLIVPILATICTCNERHLNAWPTGQLLELLDGILLAGRLRRLTGGTARLAAELGRDIALHAGHPVESIRQFEAGVLVGNGKLEDREFDRVIIATQANQLGFLDDRQFGHERDFLARVPYVDGELVVHRDLRTMPRRRSDWTALNFLMDRELGQSMFTVWVNAVEPTLSARPPVLQSWDPIIELDPAQVIRRIPLQRAVVNGQSQAVPETVREWHRQPGRRVFYCGSWAWEGVPLLETAVRSAQAVVERIRLDPV